MSSNLTINVSTTGTCCKSRVDFEASYDSNTLKKSFNRHNWLMSVVRDVFHKIFKKLSETITYKQDGGKTYYLNRKSVEKALNVTLAEPTKEALDAALKTLLAKKSSTGQPTGTAQPQTTGTPKPPEPQPTITATPVQPKTNNGQKGASSVNPIEEDKLKPVK